MRKKHKSKRIPINQWIRVPKLRVIDESGKNLGIVARGEALKLAEERGLDLVLIAEKADPPVAKIIDYHKFLYQQKRKQREARKKAKKSVVKDLKISLFMAENDKNRFIQKAKEFISEGCQVKFNLVLKGRQRQKGEAAIKLLKEIAEQVDNAKIVKEPKVEGNVARMILSAK